jgi:hypothetical protein
LDTPDAFYKALTQLEQQFSDEYEDLYPGCARSVHQHPVKHSEHSTPTHLHTLIKNLHIVFADVGDGSCRRWLLSSEALAAQGFPVYPKAKPTDGAMLTSFNIARVDRDIKVVSSQAGNAMHVQVAFVAMLHSYLCWPRADATPFSQYIVGAAKRRRTSL